MASEKQKTDWKHLKSWPATVCVLAPCNPPPTPPNVTRVQNLTSVHMLPQKENPGTGVVKENSFIYSLTQNLGGKVLSSFPTSMLHLYRTKKWNKFWKLYICIVGYVILFQSSESLSWREVLSYPMVISYCSHQGMSWGNFNSLETIL